VLCTKTPFTTNLLDWEIKMEVSNVSRLNSRDVCYHSVQNLLYSCVVSISLKIKIYRTIILLIVLDECKVCHNKGRI